MRYLLVLLAVAQARTIESNQPLTDDARRAIAGSEEAGPYHFPWQAAVFIRVADGGKRFCGGALIHPEWIATAAYCTDNAESYTVVLGANNLSEATRARQTFVCTEAHTHEQWTSKSAVNDIALLKLPRSARITRYVQLLSLPYASQLDNDLHKSNATTIGWGTIPDKKGRTAHSDTLKYRTASVLSNAACALLKRDVRIWWRGTNICVRGSKAKGACTGDYGGPLVHYDTVNEKPFLAGVTSFERDCESGRPILFTRVTSFASWITNKIGITLHE